MKDKKRLSHERRWYICNIQIAKKFEFEIVEKLSAEFSIKSLCDCMNISRSGYYKWIKTKDILNKYEINRLELKKIIEEIHKKKPSYGYRRINRNEEKCILITIMSSEKNMKNVTEILRDVI